MSAATFVNLHVRTARIKREATTTHRTPPQHGTSRGDSHLVLVLRLRRVLRVAARVDDAVAVKVEVVDRDRVVRRVVLQPFGPRALGAVLGVRTLAVVVRLRETPNPGRKHTETQRARE